jgi:ribosomal-protein-alanine N-acetyltransferase
MSPSLRQAGPRDLDALVALEARSFSRPWARSAMEEELLHPHAEVWVLEDEGGLVGYLALRFGVDEASVLNVAVDPDRRRQGHGRRLLAQAEERARDEDVPQLFLEVRAGNSAAIELYFACGYVQVGIRRAYYGDGEDALVLHREIEAAVSPAAN